MLRMLRSTVQPVHNGSVVAYITSSVYALSQDMMHVTFSELVMHSYLRYIVNLSFTFAV